MNLIRRSTLAVLGLSVVALMATTAYAVPAPQHFAPRAIDSGGSMIAGGQGSSLIVGGSRSFGTAITAQGAITTVAIGGGLSGGNQIDNFRRAQFVSLATTTVPEPGTMWLFAAGAAAMLLVSRRTRKTSR